MIHLPCHRRAVKVQVEQTSGVCRSCHVVLLKALLFEEFLVTNQIGLLFGLKQGRSILILMLVFLYPMSVEKKSS